MQSLVSRWELGCCRAGSLCSELKDTGCNELPALGEKVLLTCLPGYRSSGSTGIPSDLVTVQVCWHEAKRKFDLTSDVHEDSIPKCLVLCHQILCVIKCDLCWVKIA